MATTEFDNGFKFSTVGKEPDTTEAVTEQATVGGTLLSHATASNYYQEVSAWLFILLIPVVTVTGLVGNTLSVIVVRRSSLSASSVSVYITALAAADTMTLIFNFANNWISAALEVNTLRVSSIGCGFARYCFDVSSSSASLCVVAMAVERCIVVWFPFRASTLCTRRNAIKAVSVIFLLVAVIYLYHLAIWYMDETGSCSITSPVMQRLAPLISGSLFSYIPIITLSFTTTVICVQLACMRKQREGMTSQTGNGRSSNSSSSDDATRKITIMVVVICVLFLLFTLPVAIFYIIWFNLPVLVRYRSQSLGVIRTVIQMLALSNHAVNFFLYTLSSEAFRKELRVMCCRGRAAESPRPSTSTANTNVSTIA